MNEDKIIKGFLEEEKQSKQPQIINKKVFIA